MKKTCCILAGSPRKDGNTEKLTVPFIEELSRAGFGSEIFHLHKMDLKPCIACGNCQDIYDGFGCPLEDDMNLLFHRILESDLLVLATPVYSWQVTPPMKAVMDRMVYGMNKYYGREENPLKGLSLWEGKSITLIVTCGYPPAKGADLLEGVIQRYSGHSKLKYKGMLAERDLGYGHTFMDKEKTDRARAFARKLANDV